MANTTNLNLVKPAGTDKALVSVLNSNSDKIDAFAGTTNQALSTLINTQPFNFTTSNQNNYTSPMIASVYDQVNGMKWCTLVVSGKVSGSHLTQTLMNDEGVAVRSNENGTWSSWSVKKYALTSNLVSVMLSWNTGVGFKLPDSTPAPVGGRQIALCGRNTTNGSIYAVWYDGGSRSFRMGSVISGSNPSDGEAIALEYLA